MVLAGRSKLRVSKSFFRGDIFFTFVEYFCKRSPKIKTKNIKNYSSILAIVNHRNWLDDSPPSNPEILNPKSDSVYISATQVLTTQVLSYSSTLLLKYSLTGPPGRTLYFYNRSTSCQTQNLSKTKILEWITIYC